MASSIVGPVDIAVDPFLGFHGVRVQEYRYHEERASCPGRQRDHLRDERRPNFRRGDRMANGDVTIRAHDEEEYAAGELVDTCCGHVRLAHYLPEYPTAQTHRRDEERYTYQETLVRYRQVHDVHVRYGLHFRESQHHVDDECVAEEADDADDGVKNLVDQRNDRQIGLAVLDSRVLLTRYLRVIDTRAAYHGCYRACHRGVHLDFEYLFIKLFSSKKKNFLKPLIFLLLSLRVVEIFRSLYVADLIRNLSVIDHSGKMDHRHEETKESSKISCVFVCSCVEGLDRFSLVKRAYSIGNRGTDEGWLRRRRRCGGRGRRHSVSRETIALPAITRKSLVCTVDAAFRNESGTEGKTDF